MDKRILVIGKGHLGTFLKTLWNLPDELHWKSEMAGLDEPALKRIRPDAVVNTAGKTDLAWCESNPGECFRCNVAAPLGVYRTVRTLGTVPYIHLSSGCVWDGPYKPNGMPFQPNDPPTPACFYAWSKAACDALLLDEAEASLTPLLILRPRQVYSPEISPRNTLTKLNGYPKLLDTPNSMTSTMTIANTVEMAVKTGLFWGRIMNVYDKGCSSPFEVGTLLAEAGCRKPPEKLTKNELDAWHKPKRVDAVIQDMVFERFVNPPTVQEELRRNIALYAGIIPMEI